MVAFIATPLVFRRLFARPSALSRAGRRSLATWGLGTLYAPDGRPWRGSSGWGSQPAKPIARRRSSAASGSFVLWDATQPRRRPVGNRHAAPRILKDAVQQRRCRHSHALTSRLQQIAERSPFCGTPGTVHTLLRAICRLLGARRCTRRSSKPSLTKRSPLANTGLEVMRGEMNPQVLQSIALLCIVNMSVAVHSAQPPLHGPWALGLKYVACV